MNLLRHLQPISFSRTQPHYQGYGRWLLSSFVAPIAVGVVAFTLLSTSSSSNSGSSDKSAAIAATTPTLLRLMHVQDWQDKPALRPLGATIEFVVRRNDTLERIFRQLQINLTDLSAIRGLPNIRGKLESIKPGDMISIVHLDGTLQQMARRLSDTEILKVHRDTDGFSSTVVTTPLTVKTKLVHGQIESSLFAAARSVGMNAETVMRLANDIFGWDIDFALDIQPGDAFTVLYEQKYRDGTYIGDGKILAAEFNNAGQTYQAIRFESENGEISDYFTPNGRSMRKQFLRAPLDFNRVSSNFSNARLHPILNRIRAHQGVDYSAPTGTPIKAAGDGRVDSISVKGGYGKAIILEHGGGITTLYGHMSRYAEGMRDGTRVKQGQIIGYVGSTGAATGPHLHYEYRVNGTHKNPRTVLLPDAQPVQAKYQAEFETKRAILIAQLQPTEGSPVTASTASLTK